MTITARDPWQGANVRRARAYVEANLIPAPCPHCHQPVTTNEPWVVGHIVARWERPDLALEPSNWRAEHRACSDRTGPAEQAAKRRHNASQINARRTSTTDHPRRTVILIHGAPGAGKTTRARELAAQYGLTIYDKDDPHWTSEPQFIAALTHVGDDPNAQAVIIRTNPSTEWTDLVRPTQTETLDPGIDQCKARARARGRGVAAAIKAIDDYYERHNVKPFTHFSSGALVQAGPAPARTHTRVEVRPELGWEAFVEAAPGWLAGLLDVPADAGPPLAMTPVHPDATGSYGEVAVSWMESTLIERGQALRLRWFQRLIVFRLLEHRADGSLCWPSAILTTPRQVGKSTLLRALALWRIAEGPAVFEPEQLVMHTGRTLSIVREVMGKAYAFAGPRRHLGWDRKRGMTEPQVSFRDENRWVARSEKDTTGYSVSMALVDEAWGVSPSVVDDDLAPTMLDRLSPQLVLISTAHSKATALMTRRVSSALAADDGEVLLLWWGDVDGEQGDPATWRAASPFWNEARAKAIGKAYQNALDGKEVPDAEDLDPIEGFACQYLNRHTLREVSRAKAKRVVEPGEWRDREAAGGGWLVAVAVESWFGEGCAVATARLLDDGRVLVGLETFPGLPGAAAYVDELKPPAILAGKSLAGDSLLAGAEPIGGTTRQAMLDLRRMLDDGALVHDGSPALAEQVLALRSAEGPDGARLVSKARADGVKAVSWAAARARALGEQPKIY